MDQLQRLRERVDVKLAEAAAHEAAGRHRAAHIAFTDAETYERLANLIASR